MTMTDERLAKLDAAIARFPVSLPWYSCATSRNGVTGIHGEPHGEPPHQGVAYLADVFGDAAPVVEAMNSLPDLRAHIDAQAATIARQAEALREAQGWFAEYAVMHLDKNTPEGVAKAASNARKAEYCAAALTGAA